MKVLMSRRALNSLKKLSDYISEEIKMPETALRYETKMRTFAKSLGDFPLKHPECRFKKLKSKAYRCATFDKKWIFIYSVSDVVIIRDVKFGAIIKS
jgi:plasmid stabilization system protein ParE